MNAGSGRSDRQTSVVFMGDPAAERRRDLPYDRGAAPRRARCSSATLVPNSRLLRRNVSVLDVNTGKDLWKFYTTPCDPSKGFENKAIETAAKTWAGEWWKMGGGGSMWDGMA
jgi:quinohemoprotein ethanol dehydrogenase